MASCKKCGNNVGCSCKLKGGLCATCQAKEAAEKAQQNVSPNPPTVSNQ